MNFIMLINWTVMILYNYFNAMFVGPGFVPLGWKPVRKRFLRMVSPHDNHIFSFCLICQPIRSNTACSLLW